MKKTNVNEFDFEGEPPGEPEETPISGKGVIVSKTAIIEWTGLAAATVDRTFKDGAPYLSKGSRKQGYRINSAQWFDWYWRQKVLNATGGDNPDSQSYEVAKRRDKEAQATLRELQIKQRAGEFVHTERASVLAAQKFSELRAGLLSLPSQVMGLPPEYREQLEAAVHDMLAEVSTKKVEFDAAMADGKEEPSED